MCGKKSTISFEICTIFVWFEIFESQKSDLKMKKKNVYAIVLLGNFIERMERWPFVISDSF